LFPNPQASGKIVRKGLDFFWEQSLTGPTAGAPIEGARSVGIPTFENQNGRMMEGNLVLACSGVNRIALVEVKLR
jgi:hypothetical protein